MSIKRIRRMTAMAGMVGFRNADPFSAASQPQQQQAFQSAPQQQPQYPQQQPQQHPAFSTQPQQQQPPLTAPNTIYPNQQPVQDPDHANAMPSANGEGLSPLDQIMNQFYNDSSTQQQPQQQQAPQQAPAQAPQQPQSLDLTKLNMDDITKHAQGMDFSSGVSEDTIAKFAIDPATGQPTDLLGGIMEIMNTFGRNTYSQAVRGSSTLAGTSLQQQMKTMQQGLPSMIGRHQVASAIEGKGYHKAMQPMIAQHAQQLLKTNPNIRPEEATAQIETLVQALSQQLTQQYQHNPEQEQAEQAAHGSSIFDEFN